MSANSNESCRLKPPNPHQLTISGQGSGGLRAALHRRLSRAASHDNPEKSAEAQLAECGRLTEELNTLLALFRDLLIGVGKIHDGPELRDRLKQTRLKCVEVCATAGQLLMPHIRSQVAEGIPVDSQHLVNLVCCTQLLLRELHKCKQLVAAAPMDMTKYYERRPRNSSMSVLERLVLWKPQQRDHHQDEMCSITRDVDCVATQLADMQEFMPVESNCKTLTEENVDRWRRQSRIRSGPFYNRFGDWCCMGRSSLSSS